jgi:hypothetical protein
MVNEELAGVALGADVPIASAVRHQNTRDRDIQIIGLTLQSTPADRRVEFGQRSEPDWRWRGHVRF